ncbi:conserved Plasmodium protein, unknown function [Plasmodium malariae]|uniref:Uncharacterized protein n=1 Tax=Plasmodium malariae TaxID=5858 RepID=A0A1D3PC90_PLAMA|nr:conserved Plasmodium protein, unknown function [Plasmodium malariae]SCN12870.1 conserved Plasmodium protein, unknown function [Plasmodium malariae]
MKGVTMIQVHTTKEGKKSKCVILGVRVLSIISVATYIVLFSLIPGKLMLFGQEQSKAYNIFEEKANILKNNKIFGNYYRAYNIINITCGSFLICLNLINMLCTFGINMLCIKLINYKKYIQPVNLHLQLLFISVMFMQNLENKIFYCNIKEYAYWFKDYNDDNITNVFTTVGNNLCVMHNFAYIFLSFFFFLSLIEFFVLYIRTDGNFRKKFFLFYLKLFTGYIYLSLFYIYLKNRNFFKKILSEYNVLNLENLSETVKIIIYATQKQKNYYFQLLLVSTIISAVVFSILSYYDLYAILKTCKFALLVGILTNACTLVFIVSQVMFSSYLYEASKFFCSYEEYLKINESEQVKVSTTTIVPSNNVETTWFCNLNIFLYIYLANNFTGLLTFLMDLALSAYMVFSKKYVL